MMIMMMRMMIGRERETKKQCVKNDRLAHEDNHQNGCLLSVYLITLISGGNGD